MDRREFLKTAAAAGVSLALPGLLLPDGSAAAAEKLDMVVAKGPSPARITRAAVDAFGGIAGFVSRGDSRDQSRTSAGPYARIRRTNESEVGGNPVRSASRACRGRQEGEGLRPHRQQSRRAYKQSGIADAAAAAGADLSFVENRKFRE